MSASISSSRLRFKLALSWLRLSCLLRLSTSVFKEIKSSSLSSSFGEPEGKRTWTDPGSESSVSEADDDCIEIRSIWLDFLVLWLLNVWVIIFYRLHKGHRRHRINQCSYVLFYNGLVSLGLQLACSSSTFPYHINYMIPKDGSKGCL